MTAPADDSPGGGPHHLTGRTHNHEPHHHEPHHHEPHRHEPHGAGEAAPAPAMRAKVVTVSDGVVAGTRDDASGAALERLLQEAGWEVAERSAIADGAESVASELRRLAEGFNGLIVTTGGTGFGPRDFTPEGTRAVLDREAPGLAESMRLVNPLGRLSRGVAGTCGQALILNTPGSSSGSVETLEAVLDVVGHAVRLLVDNYDPHPHTHSR